jgi:hypothetical protein
VTIGAVAAWLGRIHQDRCEPLDPPEQGHMVDLDASLSEELLEIPVRQSLPQVQRTAIRMTSGGNLNPANPEPGCWTGGPGWRWFIWPAWSTWSLGTNRTAPRQGRAQCNSASISHSIADLPLTW